MIPLSERPGFGQLSSLDDVGGDELPGEKFREKFNARLTLIAESGDALITKAASHVGSRLNFQTERLAVLARINRRVYAEAREAIFSEEIERFRAKVERDIAEATEREQRTAAAEQRAIEQRWEAEAQGMNIGELLSEIERGGARLSLVDGDQIVLSAGALNQRQRVILRTPRMRRDLILALQGREHREVV